MKYVYILIGINMEVREFSFIKGYPLVTSNPEPGGAMYPQCCVLTNYIDDDFVYAGTIYRTCGEAHEARNRLLEAMKGGCDEEATDI